MDLQFYSGGHLTMGIILFNKYLQNSMVYAAVSNFCFKILGIKRKEKLKRT